MKPDPRPGSADADTGPIPNYQAAPMTAHSVTVSGAVPYTTASETRLQTADAPKAVLKVRTRSVGQLTRSKVTDLVAVILGLILVQAPYPGAAVADGSWLAAVVIAMTGQLLHLGLSLVRHDQLMPWWATPVRTVGTLPLAACVVVAVVQTGLAAPAAANALAFGGSPSATSDPNAPGAIADAVSTTLIPTPFAAVIGLAVGLILLALAPRRTDAGRWHSTIVLWAWLSPVLIAAGLALSTAFALTGSNRLHLGSGNAAVILTVTVPLVALVLAQIVLLLWPATGNALRRSGYRPLLVGVGAAALLAGFDPGVLHDPLLPGRFLPGLAMVVGGCALGVGLDRDLAPGPADPLVRSAQGAVVARDVVAFRGEGGAAVSLRLLLITTWLIAAGVIAGTVGESLRLDLPVRPLAAAGLGSLLMALACTMAAFLFQRDGLHRPIGTVVALLLAAAALLGRLLVEHALAPADPTVKETIRGVVVLGWPLLGGGVAAAIWAVAVRTFELRGRPGERTVRSAAAGDRILATEGSRR